MAAIYSNGGNRWNILGFNFTKRDALSSVYKISMVASLTHVKDLHPMNSNCVLSHSCAQAIFTTQTTHPSIKFSQNIAEFAV
jgi:hypothetical protein